MIELKGIVRGNTIVLEKSELKNCEGREVLIRVLDYPHSCSNVNKIDLNSFVIPTLRGETADRYLNELRKNDRI